MNKTPDWLKKIVHIPDIDTNIKLFGGHKQHVPYKWKAERETHYAFEMMFILSGTKRIIFSGTSYDFVAEDMVLIPPGTPHENQCVSEEGMTYFCVHFDIDDPIIQQRLLMYCPIFLRKDNTAYQSIEAVIQGFIQLLDCGDFGLKKKLKVQQLIIELVLCLLDYADYEQVEMKKSDNTTLILAIEIAKTLQENFRQFTKYPTEENFPLLSLQQIAESLNISESTMLKIFKKVYSVCPKYYLDRLRYNESKKLLHQPGLSIGEIGEIVGYQNVSHFSRQFKNWNGQSPKQYRQEINEIIQK